MKEEAEWYKEFCSIKRIDTLDLPTWEELNCMNFKRFDFLSKNRGIITIWIDLFDNLIITNNNTYKEMFKASKENYIKVCRKAKELFLED